MAKKIGTFRCAFAGLRQDFITGDMEMVFKIHKDFKSRAKTIVDESKELDLSVTVDKYVEKRSLDANAYFWLLAGRLASVLRISVEDIYRQYIKGIGNNFEIVPIRNDAKERWIQNWTKNGIGWICEDMGESKLEGYSNIICFYGSSTYDSQQMSCLIDFVIQDCKEQGIETLPPERLEAMRDEWAKKQAG